MYATDKKPVKLGYHVVQLQDAVASCVRHAVGPLELDSGWFSFPDGAAKTFVDIGANIGMVSLYIALSHPNWLVIAAEPVPFNYQNLVENIVHAGCHNILPLPFGIGHTRTAIEPFMIHPANTGGATNWTSLPKDHPGHGSQFGVLLTLNDIFDRFVPMSTQCEVILKVDIEGAEHTSLSDFNHWHRITHLHLDSHENDALRVMGFSHQKIEAFARSMLPATSTLRVPTVEKGD